MSKPEQSELEALRAQVATLTQRLDHYERHASRMPYEAPSERPNGKLTSRLNSAFDQKLPTLAARLRSILADRYQMLASGDNLIRGITYGNQNTVTLEQLPYTIAAELTGETEARLGIESAERGALLAGNDNSAKLERLKVELEARREHTQKLLAKTRLPEMPAKLLAKIELTKPRKALSSPYGGYIQPPHRV